jgi:hypothetical protein
MTPQQGGRTKPPKGFATGAISSLVSAGCLWVTTPLSSFHSSHLSPFFPMKIPASFLVLFATLGLASVALPQAPATPQARQRKASNDPNAGKQINENKATPPERIKVMKDFKVELLYSVPIAEQGSWVAMCVDNKGRLIVSDQYGYLYRFAPPAPGQPLDPKTIERLDVPLKAANGLLWAFNALWAGVNDYENGENTGLYRITAS